MGWFLNLISTKYGTVTSGKYKGCSMGLGNDGNKKIEVNATCDQMLFIKGFKEVARVKVSTVKKYRIVSQTARATVITVVYDNGENSTITLPAVDANGKPWNNDRVGLVLSMFANCEVY